MSSSNNSISTSTTASTTTTNHSRFPKKLFMGVSPSTTELSLRQVMQGYGRVFNVHVPHNEHGHSRGFAFVTFQWHEDAAFAMEDLEGSKLDGLILHPRWAAPKSSTKPQQKKKKRNGSRKREKPKVVEA